MPLFIASRMRRGFFCRLRLTHPKWQAMLAVNWLRQLFQLSQWHQTDSNPMSSSVTGFTSHGASPRIEKTRRHRLSVWNRQTPRSRISRRVSEKASRRSGTAMNSYRSHRCQNAYGKIVASWHPRTSMAAFGSWMKICVKKYRSGGGFPPTGIQRIGRNYARSVMG